jgi:acetolactate decarboxylase
VSTIEALLAGVYDGAVTFGELAEHGDFGIGTFHGLDGEMVGLDGRFYRVGADGTVSPVEEDEKTPFSVVTFFEPDRSADIGETLSFDQLTALLDNFIYSKHIFYAIRIDGFFHSVTARSVPRQEKPYAPLGEVIEDQVIFELENVTGTLVGFWCPASAQGLNVPGYHLHFVTDDRTAGGHVLDIAMEYGRLSIDETSAFFLVLPKSDEFLRFGASGDREQDLKRVEGR